MFPVLDAQPVIPAKHSWQIRCSVKELKELIRKHHGCSELGLCGSAAPKHKPFYKPVKYGISPVYMEYMRVKSTPY